MLFSSLIGLYRYAAETVCKQAQFAGKDRFQHSHGVGHGAYRPIDLQQKISRNIGHGDDPLKLFALCIEDMRQGGLFQSHRFDDIGNGLLPRPLIKITTVEALLPGSGSGVRAVTRAVFAKLPEAVSLTVPRRRMVRVSPGATVPSASIPGQGWKAPPFTENCGSKSAAAVASVNTASSAASGPKLVTTIV